MVKTEFPIGQFLTAVSILEDEEFPSNELCLDKVQLIFQDSTVTKIRKKEEGDWEEGWDFRL